MRFPRTVLRTLLNVKYSYKLEIVRELSEYDPHRHLEYREAVCSKNLRNLKYFQHNYLAIYFQVFNKDRMCSTGPIEQKIMGWIEILGEQFVGPLLIESNLTDTLCSGGNELGAEDLWNGPRR